MRFLKLALVAGSMLAATMASAQTPAPPAPPAQPAAGGTPDKVPADIPYGLSIGIELAKKVMAAAEAEGIKRGWKECIAVADTNGDLVYFVRMEGAQIGSVVASQGKARTAARYRRDTRIFYNLYETGHPYISTIDPTLVASAGGYPLIENGKVIGAIGCSGGTGDQDAVICKAGADVVK